jgi:hypothetical protein
MLTILYRSCDKEIKNSTRKGRPVWFDKFKSFKSLHNSIQASKWKNDIKLITIMDGNESELSDYIKNFNYDVYFCKKFSNEGSLQFVLDFSYQFKNDNIYFIEDDYLHLECAIDHLYPAIEKFGLITGYDHMDRYVGSDDICANNESIHYFNERHWRTCESTTCTWAVSNKMYDTVMPAAKHFLLNDRDLFRYLYVNKIKLYTPILGVSTHIHNPHMSPGINWESINNLL